MDSQLLTDAGFVTENSLHQLRGLNLRKIICHRTVAQYLGGAERLVFRQMLERYGGSASGVRARRNYDLIMDD